ncbi:hypothetical protein ABZT17_35105 [Streptomyces sp. NPDC005648]|uniref:hypothetical protein n=1 Tax=Streptomyces sp. NPDC005648 TaxID=3157044 RepID=UPI0033BD1A0D
MTDIVFNPTFTHTEFVDGPDGDRVRADEPNGLNKRFTAIESDLRRLSGVVDEIAVAVAQRGTGPVTHLLDLPPRLLPVVDGPITPASWRITAGGAAQAVGNGVSGVMEMALPDNVQLVSFRARGRGGTGSVGTAAVTLVRTSILDAPEDTLASVSGDSDPFDRTQHIDLSLATTSTATFRYLVRATVASTTAPVTIAGFQIVYTTS